MEKEIKNIEIWLRKNCTNTSIQKDINSYGDKKKLTVFFNGDKRIGEAYKINGVLMDAAIDN